MKDDGRNSMENTTIMMTRLLYDRAQFRRVIVVVVVVRFNCEGGRPDVDWCLPSASGVVNNPTDRSPRLERPISRRQFIFHSHDLMISPLPPVIFVCAETGKVNRPPPPLRLIGRRACIAGDVCQFVAFMLSTQTFNQMIGRIVFCGFVAQTTRH